MISIFIFVIILGIKDLIFEINKRLCNRKLIIVKGLKKNNYELFLGTLYMTLFIILCVLSYIRSFEMIEILILGVSGIGAVKNLLKSIKNEIREDGIYTNKGIYKWNEINRYECIKIKKRKNFFEYTSLRFYIDGGYADKIMIDVAMEDKEKIEKFLNEIGLKQ